MNEWQEQGREGKGARKEREERADRCQRGRSEEREEGLTNNHRCFDAQSPSMRLETPSPTGSRNPTATCCQALPQMGLKSTTLKFLITGLLPCSLQNQKFSFHARVYSFSASTF